MATNNANHNRNMGTKKLHNIKEKKNTQEEDPITMILNDLKKIGEQIKKDFKL